MPIANGNVYFRKWGTGKTLLIALHGFGVDGGMFASLAGYLTENCTFYAIDLPFHGKTQWNKNSFEPTDIQNIIYRIQEREKSTHCSLLGHSFGARLVLKLSEDMDVFDQLFLLSPDGIRTYWLEWSELLPHSWRRWIMRRLQNPNWLLSLAARLRRWGWIPAYVEQFLTRNLSSAAARTRLLHIWLSTPAFKINLENRSTSTRMKIIVGSNDPMLDVAAVERFARKMKNAEICVLDGKHYLPASKVAPIMMDQIKASRERP